MRALITGGAGFIGSHVCDRYLEDGWEVTALDDLSTGRPENVPSAAELVEMDIRSEALGGFLKERGFDVVNHHAAQIDVRVSVRDPQLDASVNVMGLLNLLEGARDAGVRRVVYISSGGVVYGEGEALPIPEEGAKRPLSPYGVGKLAGEHYLWYYRKVHGLSGVSLRYSNVYGARQDPHGEAGVVAIFAGRLARGEPLTIYGNGEQTRDYVYVKDVAAANLLLSEKVLGEPHGPDDVAFNVATGKQTSVLELAENMMKASGTTTELRHEPARPGELRANALNPGKLRQAGWSGARSLQEGLRETVPALAEEVS